MPKLTKRLSESHKKRPEEAVPLAQAIEGLKSYKPTKFDQSVEIHMRLGIDAKQADQIVRGSIVLPHGIGKSQRVVVFAKGELAKAAEEAGAEVVGQADLAKKIKDGWLDFDVCVATPDMMGMVGQLGRALGHRGLMPSPKAGTVPPDFRNDGGGNVHAVVGKLSFEPQQHTENIQAFIDRINSMKPMAVKGTYVKGIVIAATMSPSVRVAA